MTCSRAPGTGPSADAVIANWAGTISVHPRKVFSPDKVDAIVAIVRSAEALGLTVRAMGSAWSFSDAMVTPDYEIKTDALKQILSETVSAAARASLTAYADPVFRSLLPAARRPAALVHVQAGIKIHDLCDALEHDPRFRSGSAAGDGAHGYAVPTLGGSGGQALAGAVSTGTHGGDVALPPIADMVVGIHLVGSGGHEFFLQRASAPIVGPDALAAAMPCVAGRVISDDAVFDAALVSVGCFGIVHSYVVAVRPQFFLSETRRQSDWATVSGELDSLRSSSHRFLQIVIAPYAPSGARTCFVTQRTEVPAASYHGPTLAPAPSFFAQLAQLPNVGAILGPIVAGLAATAGPAALIPVVGGLIAPAEVGLLATLTPLLATSGMTLGQLVATVVNATAGAGRPDIGRDLTLQVLSGGQPPEGDGPAHPARQDLSYVVMDGLWSRTANGLTYQSGSLYKVLSLEVAFDADPVGSAPPAYVTFLHSAFARVDAAFNQKIVYAGYISLRYCGQSRATLAIQKWPRTVCIEFSTLHGVNGQDTLLQSIEQLAFAAGGAVHWGQLNHRTASDTAARFPGLPAWRAAHARVTAGASPTTFKNTYCDSRGLHP